MDFFIDQTSLTDDEIQESFYPGMTSDADGIDLRIEMNRMLYGTMTKKPLGHWVIARVFSGDEKSVWFNEYTKEGIGGTNHPFTDYLVRARRVPGRFSRSQLNTDKIADIGQHKYVYYFEWDVPLRDGDQIYELKLNDHTNKPDINNLVFNYKEDIARVHHFRLENGNTQYIEVLCKYNNVLY